MINKNNILVVMSTEAALEQVQAAFKADISFNRGYSSYRSDYRKLLWIHSVEIIMFAVIIPIDCTLLTIGDKMPVALGIAAADSLVSLLIVIYKYYALFVNRPIEKYVLLARDILHVTAEPITSFQSEATCTSETVLFAQSGVDVAGLNDQIIKVYGNIAQQEIQQANQYRYPQIAWWDKAYNFLSMLTMLLVIILLATSTQLNTAQITVLVIFLALEAFIKLKIIVILLLIALSPLLCIIFLCYVCCCRPRDGQTMAIDLKARAAGSDEIVKSGGDCAICLQNIKIGEPVYQLKCSQKHIFHQGCLQNWSRVKANCPSCRADLPLTEAQPVVQEAE